MTPRLLLRLLRRNALWLVLLPLLAALTAYWFSRDQPRKYRSTAVLYTGLASGYSILSEAKETRIDHNAVSNAFDNLLSTINSRETITQVGVRLLTRHLSLDRPDSLVLGRAGFARLRQAIPDGLRTQLTAGNNEYLLHRRLDSLAHAVGNNPVKRLLFGPVPSLYSIASIGKELKVTRKNTSDMLELAYESEDPAVAYATLDGLIRVFSTRYAGFKSSETNPVVRYYEGRNRQANQQLHNAESRLREFGKTNKILNYEEQSKSLTANKEALETAYHEEQMRNRAAKAAVNALGKRMENRTLVTATNEEFKTKRQELETAANHLANAQVYGRGQAVIEQLAARYNQLSEEFKTTAQKYYNTGNTAEGLPQAHLLDEWLDKMLQAEESSARLEVYEKRMTEYDQQAAKFAPLGSELSDLNRSIGVAEKDYLSTLQELNQAQARQKNAEMAGSLTLLDAPEFPLQALPSKRGMLVGAALGVGLVLALLVLLLRYLLDGRILTPSRVESLTGLPVAAAFPRTGGLFGSARIEATVHSMFEQLRSALGVGLIRTTKNRPYALVTVWSTRPGQGKTWLTRQLAERYALAGQRVIYLHPHSAAEPARTIDGLRSVAYRVGGDFSSLGRIDELFGDESDLIAETYDLVLLELPDLSRHAIPAQLVAQSNLSVLTVSAGITWSRSDQNLASLYQRASVAPVLAVLNRVEEGLIEGLSTAPAPVVPMSAYLPQPQLSPAVGAVPLNKVKSA